LDDVSFFLFVLMSVQALHRALDLLLSLDFVAVMKLWQTSE
jgi:hypothetical protein